MFASEAEWPAVWSWTERQKYLSSDGASVFRFDGHGHYGKSVRQRSEILAAHNWGPPTISAGDGFSVSPWVEGTHPINADRDILIQLARYCAFRAEHFVHETASASALEEVTRINLELAVGVSRSVVLPIERPVITDSRMMPHEWIVAADGGFLKFDAAAHGDDHFYPGPTDIAWDLAGTIVEWNLASGADDLLVSEYTRIAGDKISTRMTAYLVAYYVLRLGIMLSAAISVRDASQRLRFDKTAESYRKRLVALLR